MRYTISVPEPCHESWENMTRDGSGRHCEQCCKTVIDFSSWQPEDIVGYLREHSGQRVCGRFHKGQLDTTIDTDTFIIAARDSPLPFYYKVAAILLLSFGLPRPVDSAAQPQYKAPPQKVEVAPSHTLGEPVAPVHKQVKKKKVKKAHVHPADKHISGDVALIPEDRPEEHMAGLVAMHPMPPDTTKKKTK